MQIKKSFHFYAGHRNEKLKDKCFSLHGHVYRIVCVFGVERDRDNPDVSTLFSDFDIVGEMIKEKYDHSLLISAEDPLLPTLLQFDNEQRIEQKRVVLPRATSAENLCYSLFGDIVKMRFSLQVLELAETESSTVIYTKQDWEADTITFNEVKEECDCVFGGKMNCIKCGRSSWEYKLAKRAQKNDRKQATGGESGS